MSSQQRPGTGKMLYRQHLSTATQSIKKGDMTKGTKGNLYEIPPSVIEQSNSGKKPVNYGFTSQAALKNEELRKKEIKNFKEMVKRASFGEEMGYSYDNYPAIPLANFLPLLTRRITSSKFVPVTAKLKLNMPDSFVSLGKEDIKMWLMTDEDGYLERIDNYTNRDLMMAIGRPKGRENELTALLKFKNRKGLANETSTLNTEDLKNVMISPPGGDWVIQRFVQAKGAHPWIVRIVYRTESQPFGYTMTSKSLYTDDTEGDFRKRFTVCTDVDLSCTIVKTTGISIADPIQQTENIMRYVQRQHGLHLNELVCDFIKDENNVWWFLQVKAFRVTPECLTKWKNLQNEQMNTAGGQGGGGGDGKKTRCLIILLF